MSENLPRACGIYQIRCTITGKVYVGSAVDLRDRWSKHRSALRRERHVNPHLQAAWNRYGEQAFCFEVLELAGYDVLLTAEQGWMDRLGSRDPARGFNVYHAGSPRDVNAKVWEGFIDPEGCEVEPITNLSAFCRAHNLERASMVRLYRGTSKLKSYKGWTHKNSRRKRQYLQTYVGFIGPDGKPAGPIAHLAEFCRKHGLDLTHLVALARGRLCSHRGWTYDEGRHPLLKVHTGFVSPDGEPVMIVNLMAFCREHGLNVVHMHNVKSGKRRSHKGWTWRAPNEPSAQHE